MWFPALALLASVACSQPASPPLAFDAVSIKLSPPKPPGAGGGIGCTGGPGSSDPVRITCTHTGLFLLVRRIWELPNYRIAGIHPAPPEFQIDIRVPAGATREQVVEMWKTLLAERFQLAFHWESRKMAGFQVIVAKGGLKTAAPLPSDSPLDRELWERAAAFPGLELFGGGKARWVAPRASIAQLAAMLERQLQRPVADSTGLEGRYDLRLWWSPAAQADDPSAGPTIPEALQSQLGLKLTPRQLPVKILVMDHALQYPAGN